MKSIAPLLIGLNTIQAKDGISFVVVGDYANIKDMSISNLVFDGIESLKLNADPESAEDFDFFITVGDNIYPEKSTSPYDYEFAQMMDLYLTRDSIKDLQIYPVRGNHECRFQDQYELMKLDSLYETWNMPKNYNERTFEIG